MGSIYAIQHKDSGVVFYVGQTRVPVTRRWREHMRGRTAVSRALQLFGNMEDFNWLVLEEIEDARMNEREVFWIAQLNTAHPHGLNVRPGGSRGAVAETTKARMAEARRKMWADPTYKARVSAAIAEAARSPERRAAASASATRQMAQEGAKERISAANTGRVRASETRDKLSAQAKTRWADPEYRARMVAFASSKTMSEAAKAKISAAGKLRGANPKSSYVKMRETRRSKKVAA